MKKLLKPVDIILIAVLVLGGIGFFLFSKHTTVGATAVVYIDGEVYETIGLENVNEAYELDLPCSPKAALLVENGKISFLKAECHDKVCVNSGKLSSRNDTAACLPAGVVVVIENGEENGIDALVY